jgi:benzoyl-CoA reductase subunit C
MEYLARFKAALADPNGYGRHLKLETGKKIVGYPCSYVPEELISAAGAHPFRIFGTAGGIHLADAHLQSYCCSLVRGMLEEALSGGLDFLDGIVFPHACDSIQRLSDIWRLNIPKPFHLDLVLPVKLNTPSARQYYEDVLEKLRRDLEARLQVKISDGMIQAAVKTGNEIRRRMLQLYRLRCEKPDILKGSDFHSLIRGAMIMDRERLVDTLGGIVQELDQAATAAKSPARKRLVLAGSICSHPEIYDAIEDAGGAVVWDDLCTGSRYFEGTVDEAAPPIRAIAGRYLERIICPAKHAGVLKRGENLLRVVKESRAEGVVFLFMKFCDPHAFDYPYIREMLEKDRIPTLMVDIEEQLPSGGQLATRFETFIEIL